MHLNKLLAAASIAALAITGSAFAQSPAPATKSEAAATSTAKADPALKGTWRASKIIGLDVYNQADEKLGDVNEVLFGSDGRIAAVVIGVGGFLGMGEHDIAVSMDKLKFMETPHAKASANAKSDRTTGAANTANTRDTANGANDWTPDHAVMQATKDQLKALPEFKYSSYN
jgi:hypothetical protein